MLQLKGKLKIRRNLILRSGETTLLILTPQIKSWTGTKRKSGREKCDWVVSRWRGKDVKIPKPRHLGLLYVVRALYSSKLIRKQV